MPITDEQIEVALRARIAELEHERSVMALEAWRQGDAIEKLEAQLAAAKADTERLEALSAWLQNADHELMCQTFRAAAIADGEEVCSAPTLSLLADALIAREAAPEEPGA